MAYTAIGFDWGGVLNGEVGSIIREQTLKLLDVTAEEYDAAYFSHNKAVQKGDITWNELWRLVLTDIDRLDKLDQIIDFNRNSQKDMPNFKVHSLVDRLRTNGYKIGLLSNNSTERADELRKTGFDKHFDVFHISAETGLVKPDPAAFRLLADELRVPLSELIFIDDTPRSLSTAYECGYTPILFTDYDSLVAQLQQLGVNTN